MRREINNGRCLQLAVKRPEPFDQNGKVRYFGSGREAVLSLAAALGRDSGMIAFLPAYFPEGLTKPFEVLGWRILFYPIDLNLDPVWDTFAKMLAHEKPQLAVLIHYFGLEKDIRRFTSICHEFGTLALEDMAHVLPGTDCGLGRIGDFILYSPGKLVGVPDGGILVCRSAVPIIPNLQWQCSPLRILYLSQQICLLAISTAARRFPRGIWLKALRGFSRVALNSYGTLMAYFHHPHRTSFITRKLLLRVDWDGWARARVAHASSYATALNKRVFRRLDARTPSEGGPYGYPVLVKNRAALQKYLLERGIVGGVLDTNWHATSDGKNELNSAASIILREHFLFPVNQDLRSDEVAFVIETANVWADGEA